MPTPVSVCAPPPVPALTEPGALPDSALISVVAMSRWPAAIGM